MEEEWKAVHRRSGMEESESRTGIEFFKEKGNIGGRKYKYWTSIMRGTGTDRGRLRIHRLRIRQTFDQLQGLSRDSTEL